MRWSIDFPISQSSFPIAHESKTLSLGSCFAQTIGQKMRDSKFDILVNPFGTIFHPLNLADLLSQSLDLSPIDKRGILKRDDRFFHYQCHSDINGKSQEELIANFETQQRATHEYLKSGSHLILTLGTSWLYELDAFGRVANCHKQPQKIFQKRLSSLEEMEQGLSLALQSAKRQNPALNVVLTVSPVRHIKDGVAENQLSKSLLRVLCANLERQLDFVVYFPAYEIMMDELRDYRFYKSDLIHPTEEAENYIWSKWQKSFFSEISRQKVEEIRKIQLELSHHPMDPSSASHKIFLQNLLAKLERLNTEFDFSEEIKAVSKKINPPSPV
jgi:hypothetical protein